MHRCLELAKNGKAQVAPNPMVGCVIVYQNKIIGQGYHQHYGQAHAEVNAIHSVKDKTLLKQSTLYVNLEPCAHYGKTPPCSDFIIDHQIPKVVVGCIDSFSEVSGKGIEKMRKAGIEVVIGVLEQTSIDLNKRFFTFHTKKRPYIILKWAATQDGFMDVDRSVITNIEQQNVNPFHETKDCFVPRNDEMTSQAHNKVDNWITTPASKIVVHKWRSEEMGILIGTNTAINDNPQLNVRKWKGKNPIRIVLDLNNRLTNDLHVLDNSTPTIIVTHHQKTNRENIQYCAIDSDKKMLPQLLHILYQLEIQSVIVEGGKKLIETFIAENRWDEARVFIGAKTFTKGLKAPLLTINPVAKQQISTDTIYFYKND